MLAFSLVWTALALAAPAPQDPLPEEQEPAPAARTTPATRAPEMTGVLPPGEPAPPATPPVEGVERPVAELPRSVHGWRNGLWAGWEGITFWSREAHHYTFNATSIGYQASYGAVGPFVNATYFFPVWAFQDGRAYTTRDYYGRRMGGDLLLGWQWRWMAARAWEAEAGPGLHLAYLFMRGGPGFRSFSALPLGVGGAGHLRWRPGWRMAWWPVSLGAFASAAVDVRDPLRGNDLRNGFTFQAGATAALDSE